MLRKTIPFTHNLLSFHAACWFEHDFRRSFIGTRSFTCVDIDSNAFVVSLHVHNINIRVIDVEATQVVNIKLHLSLIPVIWIRGIDIIVKDGVPVVRLGIGVLRDY